MHIHPRALIALLIFVAVAASGVTTMLLPHSSSSLVRPLATPTPTPLVVISAQSDAYRLAVSDMATTPTAAQLTQYQVAITSIRMRCPDLDVVVGVTQMRQALHDQASRDVPALDVLQGVQPLLGDSPDSVACSAVFTRYLVQQSGG